MGVISVSVGVTSHSHIFSVNNELGMHSPYYNLAWPGRPGNHVSIALARAVSLLHIIQTDSEAHPASYSTNTNVASFHVVKKTGAWTCPLTTMLWTCYHGIHKCFTFDLGIKKVTRTTACKIQQNPKHINNCSFSELLNSQHSTHESTHTALTPSS